MQRLFSVAIIKCKLKCVICIIDFLIISLPNIKTELSLKIFLRIYFNSSVGPVARYKDLIEGWQDGLVGKRSYYVSMRTWIRVPITYKKKKKVGCGHVLRQIQYWDLRRQRQVVCETLLATSLVPDSVRKPDLGAPGESDTAGHLPSSHGLHAWAWQCAHTSKTYKCVYTTYTDTVLAITFIISIQYLYDIDCSDPVE